MPMPCGHKFISQILDEKSPILSLPLGNDVYTFPSASNFVSITWMLENMKYNTISQRARKSAVCGEYLSFFSILL